MKYLFRLVLSRNLKDLLGDSFKGMEEAGETCEDEETDATIVSTMLMSSDAVRHQMLHGYVSMANFCPDGIVVGFVRVNQDGSETMIVEQKIN